MIIFKKIPSSNTALTEVGVVYVLRLYCQYICRWAGIRSSTQTLSPAVLPNDVMLFLWLALFWAGTGFCRFWLMPTLFQKQVEIWAVGGQFH